MSRNPTPAESSHVDANQNLSIIGVQGTLGTADLGGTAPTVPFSGDPQTGAMYVYNLGPAGSVSSGSYQNISTGTQETLGTVGTLLGGGTLTNVGSLSNIGTLKGLDLVTRIGNIGTIESGTVTTTLALNTGTLTTIAAGTQNTLGTVGTIPGVGTLTNVGSLSNIGTIKEVTTIPTVTTVANVTNGSVNILTGTVTSVSNLVKGTVTALEGGTLTNLVNGTIQPTMNKTVSRAVIDLSASGDGTIVAASGNSNKTKVYGYFLVCGTTTNLIWKDGGGNLTGQMNFAANMGHSTDLMTTDKLHWFETGTNSPLILNSSANAQVGGVLVYVSEA